MNEESKYTGLKKHSEEINKLVTDSLQDALFYFLNKKNYEEISITELCKKAGVSRMAFYGNFKSKDEILNRIVKQLHIDMTKEIGSPFRATTSREWYIAYFNFILAREKYFTLFLTRTFRAEYLSLVNDIVLHEPSTPTEKKYQRLIFNGGLENATAYWLQNGKQESVEEMASYCMQNLVAWS